MLGLIKISIKHQNRILQDQNRCSIAFHVLIYHAINLQNLGLPTNSHKNIWNFILLISHKAVC